MNKRTCILIVTTFLIFLCGVTLSHADGNKFGGLGLKVAQLYDPALKTHMGPLVVLDVLSEMPAETSGVQKGDVITHIDGEATQDNSFKYLIMEKLRGKVGSQAALSIERSGVSEPLNVSLTRVEISSSSKDKSS
ncbi:MAG: PDZ domain-containing protein [Candidatus Electrothrix aestuarii]|uniref:PDZ domain-containing protein n=1 Tax=Candidatus Electrothrix aestuarii TaxID=3062594 RepID=A0AAU8LR51_9BACT|nr:PDZ domain-containing protein [Candidatus Electrothrix aestuarii]WPD21721.1 MAG: PDZ domain-containing protein [Candidatus Electrothrix sp. GW3-3]